MESMNSFEIERLLLSKGFIAFDIKTHVVGLRDEGGGMILYLKDGRGRLEEERKPVFKQPLVLHPDWAHSPEFAATRIARLGVNLAYKNDNMAAYPKLGSRNVGIAVDVPDENTLDELLGVLMGKAVEPRSAEEDIAHAPDLPVNETERQAVIAARRGQGIFRSALLHFWGGACAVTGCSNTALLRASHIQPWRDSNNEERLSPDNGLLLAVHLDAAFDCGLVSFDDVGRILFHTRFSANDAEAIGILPTMRLRRVQAGHRRFLAIHRQLHGFDNDPE